MQMYKTWRGRTGKDGGGKPRKERSYDTNSSGTIQSICFFQFFLDTCGCLGCAT